MCRLATLFLPICSPSTPRQWKPATARHGVLRAVNSWMRSSVSRGRSARNTACRSTETRRIRRRVLTSSDEAARTQLTTDGQMRWQHIPPVCAAASQQLKRPGRERQTGSNKRRTALVKQSGRSRQQRLWWRDCGAFETP
eukprot:6190125-Pleurochrysis_carterae.AAC.1